jgi:hypothetical protein
MHCHPERSRGTLCSFPLPTLVILSEMDATRSATSMQSKDPCNCLVLRTLQGILLPDQRATYPRYHFLGVPRTDQLLHLFPLMLGLLRKLHTHSIPGMRSVHLPRKLQSHIISAHHKLHQCTAGNWFGGFHVTSSRTDVRQSAALRGLSAAAINFGSQTASMPHFPTPIRRGHCQQT